MLAATLQYPPAAACLYFTSLSLFTVAAHFDCLNAAKSFVAVTPAGSTATHVYELDDSGGVEINVCTTTAYGPLPGVTHPPPPEPILPSSQEPPPREPVGSGWLAATAVVRDVREMKTTAKFHDVATAAAGATAMRPVPVPKFLQVTFNAQTQGAVVPRAPVVEAEETAQVRIRPLQFQEEEAVWSSATS